jgi:hypothetical protein
MAATLAGINCMDAVFSTMSLHSWSVATPGRVGSTIRLAARIPMGVAALPNPSMLAQMLALRSRESIGSVFAPGNRKHKNGRRIFERTPVILALSIRFPIPDQRQMDHAMAMARVIPLCAPSMVAAARSVLLSSIMEATSERNTNIVQIKLTIKLTPSFVCILCWKNDRNSRKLLQKVTYFEKSI